MASKTLIGGTAYEISGGKTLINGTGYNIYNGRTCINGTNYDVTFQKPIGKLPVGSSVYMNVNGTKREFLVVQQGLPSNMYDGSCNDTWLLMRDLYELRAWDTRRSDYKTSDIHNYLNSTFLGLFESKIQSCIKQVKIPYCNDPTGLTVSTNSNGLSTKIFLLSCREVNFAIKTNIIPDDGSPLSYFSGTATNYIIDEPKRIAYYNGSAKYWWLRSPSYTAASSFNQARNVTVDGNGSGSNIENAYGIRPALILPSNTKYDDNFNIIV